MTETNAVIGIHVVKNQPLLHKPIFDKVCDQVFENNNKLILVLVDTLSFYNFVSFEDKNDNDAINESTQLAQLMFATFHKLRNMSIHRPRIIIIKWHCLA